jgi:hypothetical protein
MGEIEFRAGNSSKEEACRRLREVSKFMHIGAVVVENFAYTPLRSQM